MGRQVYLDGIVRETRCPNDGKYMKETVMYKIAYRYTCRCRGWGEGGGCLAERGFLEVIYVEETVVQKTEDVQRTMMLRAEAVRSVERTVYECRRGCPMEGTVEGRYIWGKQYQENLCPKESMFRGRVC